MGYNNRPGGLVSGALQKEKSVIAYYSNPNKCLYCGKTIELEGAKVSQVRQKRFCNRSCAAIYNNSSRLKKIKKKVHKETREDRMKATTIGELLRKCKDYFSARSTITKIARTTMVNSSQEKKCVNCGYDKHVEVCHIRAVSEFADDETLHDMNGLHNLMYLCPNCHWEYDNKMLNIAGSTGDGPSTVS